MQPDTPDFGLSARDHPPVVRYGIAVVSVGVAILLSLWLRHVVVAAAQILLVAVLITGWFGGLGPALVASVAATVALDYYFTEPFDSLKFDAVQLLRLAIFVTVALFMAAISAARRRAEKALKSAREELTARIHERTGDLARTNEQLQREIGDRHRREDALRERASLLDLTHDTVFVRDTQDVITFWNRGAEEAYGWTRDEALGGVTHDLLQTVFPIPLADITAELNRTGRWEGELVHTRRDGTKIVVASRWALQRDERGRPVAVLETNNDVTLRKQAEADLRESERRHKHIFQTAGVSIWEEDFSQVKAAIDDLKAQGVTDFQAYFAANPDFVQRAIAMVRIVDVNEATLQMFGARTKNEVLRSLHDVFTPQAAALFAEELIAIAEGRSSLEAETELRTLQGKPLTVLFTVRVPPAHASRYETVLVTIMDITERKRTEQALEDLAGRLIHAQEEERSRIGRELHDHVSQRLGILAIRIDQLRLAPTIPPAIAPVLDALRQQTSEITNDVHGLSHRLHSSMLDHLGAVPAMQRLVDECAERYGIDITFTHTKLSDPVSSDVALCLFRVAEEGLANIAKHSRARSAHVELTADGRGMRLTVVDDGIGFDPARLETRPGLGFVSMRERLRLLHGTIRVDSTPARGTRLAVWIPPQSPAPAEDDPITV